MSFKSPLGRIQVPGRRPAEARKPIIPEFIRLPDGTRVSTQDLLAKSTKPQVYNLRNKNPLRPINRRVTPKYSLEDLLWMATAELCDIQQRYNVNENYARSLRTRGRGVAWRGKPAP